MPLLTRKKGLLKAKNMGRKQNLNIQVYKSEDQIHAFKLILFWKNKISRTANI